MKVLIPVDGSLYSGAAVANVACRAWPAGTTIEVLAVPQAGGPIWPDPSLAGPAMRVAQTLGLAQWAEEWASLATTRIQQALPDAVVTRKIVEGEPKETIVREARDWDADLVVVGCRGYGAVLGSVVAAVVAHAPCSVEVVRDKRTP